MRNNNHPHIILLVILLIGCLTIVQTKSNKQTQIEMQPIVHESDTKSFISKASHSNNNSVHSTTPSTYSTQRFQRGKKLHASNSSQDGLMAIQTQTQTNKTKKIESSGNSVLGDMIIGSLLFFAGFPCLWFNEKGYAYTKTFLRKYVKVCKSVDSAEIDPNNEEKLICVTGDTTTADTIIDPIFELSVNNSIILHRKCEMYSWVEHRQTRKINNDLNEVTYSYTLEWKNSYISSGGYSEQYGHENNQADWLYNSEDILANNVTYGAFKLTESQKKQCTKSEVVGLTMDVLKCVAEKNNYSIAQNAIPNIHENQGDSSQSQPNAPPPPQSENENNSNSIDAVPPKGYQPIPNSVSPTGNRTLKVQDGYLYFRRELHRTNPGDFRIQFTKTPCGPITVIGKQQFGSLETFCPEECQKKPEQDDDELSTEGCCACCSLICNACEKINAPISEINWVTEEKTKKKKVFQQKLSQYELKTWLMRLAGFCCFWFGVYLMLSPVYTFLYWFPLVGRFLGSIGSFICGLVGFLIAIPLSILTISIAWLFYRKEIGIPLLCVALIVIGYFSYSFAVDYKGEQSQEEIKKYL